MVLKGVRQAKLDYMKQQLIEIDAKTLYRNGVGITAIILRVGGSLGTPSHVTLVSEYLNGIKPLYQKRRYYKPISRRYRLSPLASNIAELYKQEPPLSYSQISKKLDISIFTTTKIITQLVKSNIVERRIEYRNPPLLGKRRVKIR